MLMTLLAVFPSVGVRSYVMSVGYCYELYPDEVPRSFKWDAWDPSLERNSWGFLGIPKKKGSELSSNPAQCSKGAHGCAPGE